MSVQQIQEQCAKIDAQIPINISKEGCYLMGNTGVGKSTLINYLLGQKMTYKYDKIMEKFNIFPTETSKNELPKIGNQDISETMIPKSYQSKNGLLLYDTPGFLTTMGNMQEILDSYANYKMFVKGSSIKIVLVIDEPTLKSSRGQFLPDAVERLQNMFPNQLNSLVNSICIIVTKVQRLEISQSDMAARIRSIMTQQKQVNQEKVHLFDFVLKVVERNQVYCFYSPENNTNKTINDLTQNIKSIRSFELIQDTKLTLSERSKIQLLKHAKQIQRQISQIQNQLLCFFGKIQEKGKNKRIPDLVELIKDLIQINEKYSLQNFSDEKVLQSFLTLHKQTINCEQELFTKTMRIFRDIKFCQNLYESIDCSKIMSFLIQNLRLTIEKLKSILAEYEKEEEKRKRKQEQIKHHQEMERLETQSRIEKQNYDKVIEVMNAQKQVIQARMIQNENQLKLEIQRHQRISEELQKQRLTNLLLQTTSKLISDIAQIAKR